MRNRDSFDEDDAAWLYQFGRVQALRSSLRAWFEDCSRTGTTSISMLPEFGDMAQDSTIARRWSNRGGTVSQLCIGRLVESSIMFPLCQNDLPYILTSWLNSPPRSSRPRPIGCPRRLRHTSPRDTARPCTARRPLASPRARASCAWLWGRESDGVEENGIGWNGENNEEAIDASTLTTEFFDQVRMTAVAW